jgi:hypothetical protein
VLLVVDHHSYLFGFFFNHKVELSVSCNKIVVNVYLGHCTYILWLGTDTNMLQRMQVLLKDVINLEVSDLVALLIRFTHIQEFDIFSFFLNKLTVHLPWVRINFVTQLRVVSIRDKGNERSNMLKYFYKYNRKSVSPLVYSLEVFFIPEVVKIFSQINISVVLQSQIIHKHLHVDYNSLKGMLVLISSLKLSTV